MKTWRAGQANKCRNHFVELQSCGIRAESTLFYLSGFSSFLDCKEIHGKYEALSASTNYYKVASRNYKVTTQPLQDNLSAQKFFPRLGMSSATRLVYIQGKDPNRVRKRVGYTVFNLSAGA
jgi:hypothetical protein